MEGALMDCAKKGFKQRRTLSVGQVAFIKGKTLMVSNLDYDFIIGFARINKEHDSYLNTL